MSNEQPQPKPDRPAPPVGPKNPFPGTDDEAL